MTLSDDESTGRETPEIAEAPPAEPDLRSAAFFDIDNTLIHGASMFHWARGLAKHEYLTKGQILDFVWKQTRFIVVGKAIGVLATLGLVPLGRNEALVAPRTALLIWALSIAAVAFLTWRLRGFMGAMVLSLGAACGCMLCWAVAGVASSTAARHRGVRMLAKRIERL